MLLKNLFCLLFAAGIVMIAGCDEDSVMQPTDTQNVQRLDIGLDEILANADLDVTVTPRSPGYLAEAQGRGVIPAGEYAGWRFTIALEGYYTDIDTATLVSGSAQVRIRSEHFESVMDPLLQSFCCGEGHLLLVDGEWIFSMFGQVVHTTADEPHNHLFAGLARTSGTMNMNIADQTGTVVEQADPPHDPGIGLIIGFNAMRVTVEED